MIRIVILGDVHGYDAIPILEHWKDVDKIILLGDYLDSYDDINPIDQIANAKKLFTYADKHPNIVTLLGNHDLHYVIDYERSSRQFRYQAYDEACILLRQRYNEGKLPFKIEGAGVIMSHAGLSNAWVRERMVINGTPEEVLRSLSYYPRDNSGFGADTLQSPCWIRPSWSMPFPLKEQFSFLDDDPYIGADYQFVGHTRVSKVTMDDNNIIFCDCLKVEHVLLEMEDDGDVRIYGINSNTFEKRQIL